MAQTFQQNYEQYETLIIGGRIPSLVWYGSFNETMKSSLRGKNIMDNSFLFFGTKGPQKGLNLHSKGELL